MTEQQADIMIDQLAQLTSVGAFMLFWVSFFVGWVLYDEFMARRRLSFDHGGL